MNQEITPGTPVKYIDTNGIEQAGTFHAWLRARNQNNQRIGLVAVKTHTTTMLETVAECHINGGYDA